MKIYPITAGMRLHFMQPAFRKFLLVMKLTTLLLIITLLQVSAKSFSQINVKASNAQLATVLKSVEKQSGYLFVYNANQIQLGTVTADLKNATIEETLVAFFRDKPITYQIVDKNIVLLPKKQEEPSLYDRIKEKIKAELAQVTVSGKVQDETGSPLAGVTVRIKDSQTATITDNKGFYTLTVPNENSILTFSYVGYETQELKAKDIVTGSTITLKATQTNLREVVVNKGYYDEKREFLTGNVGTVTAKEIATQPVSNVLQALEGKIPGLIITQATGTPGGSFTVQIRGQNSFNGSDPFYVIDGVPYDSKLAGSIVNSALHGGSPLNFINPYDIEKIEVLKDADATAIYGSRAANGAILITTKKGQAGAMRVNLSMNSGVSSPSREIQLLNTQQYLAVRHQAFKNDGIMPGSGDYDVNGAWDTTRNTNWIKELVQKPAPYTNIQTSVSGGNTNTQYLVGLGYDRLGTTAPTLLAGDGKDTKVSTHFNVQSVSPNGKFSIALSGSFLSDNNNTQQQDFNYTAVTLPPDAPALYNPDGSLNWQPLSPGQSGTWTNPLSILYGRYKGVTTNLVGNTVLGYKILRNLEIKTSLGYTNTQTDEINTQPTTIYDPGYHVTSGNSNFNEMNSHSYIVEPQINYNLILGKGILNVLAGASFNENIQTVKGFSASNFISDQLLENIQAAGSLSTSSNYQQYKYSAIYARANYTLEDKYVLNLTARRDGSSRFGPGKQFGNFGALGAAWLFSKERFISDNLTFLSFGKLRASYGTTGNDQIGNYQFLDLYSPYSNPYGGLQALSVGNLFNPNLAWELDKKLEFGLELGFLKDRINFEASYYRNRSGNELGTTPISTVTGYSYILTNLPAVIQNSGLELILNTVNIKTNNFSWSSSFNMSVPRNKLLSFPNLAQSSFASRYVVGQPLNIVKVYHMIGVNDATGLYQFTDIKGNPTYKPSGTTDKTSIVNLTPQYTAGFSNTIRYAGLTLDVFFQFTKQTGKNLFGAYPAEAGTMYNVPTAFLDAWQQPGDRATYQKFTTGAFFSTYSNARSSDFAYSDASYIRLKNVSLAWDLPQKWRRNIGIQNCSIFTHMENLLTFSHYVGVDPESQNYGTPPYRTITFGFQVTF